VVQGDICALPFGLRGSAAHACVGGVGGGDCAWTTTSTLGGRRRCIRSSGCGQSPNA
jgi:hypothetical protein